MTEVGVTEVGVTEVAVATSLETEVTRRAKGVPDVTPPATVGAEAAAGVR